MKQLPGRVDSVRKPLFIDSSLGRQLSGPGGGAIPTSRGNTVSKDGFLRDGQVFFSGAGVRRGGSVEAKICMVASKNRHTHTQIQRSQSIPTMETRNIRNRHEQNTREYVVLFLNGSVGSLTNVG